MSTKYIFWAVVCKSETCDNEILLKYIGVYDPKEMHFDANIPRSLSLACRSCGERYEYTDADVISRFRDGKPEGFVDQF
jgi:hypothetical protein